MENKSNEFPIFNLFKMKNLRGNSFDSSFSKSVRSAASLMEDDPRRYSVSESFYADPLPTASRIVSTPRIPTLSIPENQLVSKRYTTTQSQQLPSWTLTLITYSLGLHKTKRPILGTCIHVFTFTTALLFLISYLWVRTYDVMSPKTPLNILTGSVSIMIAMIWSALGMYAKSLCKRLFRHPRFVRDIRMHSRTIFKVNAALLAFIMGLLFVVISDIDAMNYLDPKTCGDIYLPYFVCCMHFGARVVFSVLALIWNTLVTIVLVSLCRTHTIGVRRFIKELEQDALTYDNVHCSLFKECPMTKEDVFEETFWLDEEENLGEDSDFIIISHRQGIDKSVYVTPDSGTVSERQVDSSEDSYGDISNSLTIPGNSPLKSRRNRVMDSGDDASNAEGDVSNIEYALRLGSVNNSAEMTRNIQDILKEECSENENANFDEQRDVVDSQPSCSSTPENHISKKTDVCKIKKPVPEKFKHMSTPEILHKYWKISCRLRSTSCIFQRWLATLIALVIVWCIVYLLYWQDHSASIHDVLLFVIPLMLLPLLCSAFAEVNMEGVRMVKCICPTEERLQLVRFLQQFPLQMTVFNVCLSYGTIMTVVFAIFVAFTSRLIFTELQKN